MGRPKLKYYAPIVLFLLLLLDAQLTRMFGIMTKGSYLASFHFLILSLLFASQTFSKRYLLITAAILGVIYDSYYTGVIGIYMTILVLVVYFSYFFSKTIQQNIFTMFFSMIIFVTFFEFASLLIQQVFNLAHVELTYFIANCLGPTLLVNILLFAIFYWPFKKLFVIK